MDQPVFPFVHTPFPHQLTEWTEHRADALRAVFWEQGTGKTKLIIDSLAWLYDNECIDGALIVTPEGIHRNWTIDEIPEHLPEHLRPHYKSLAYQTRKAKTKWQARALREVVHHDGLSVLAIPYDAFVTKAGKQAAWDFLRFRKCAFILDEPSGAVKSPSAKRTRAIIKAGQYASFRRILDGTPITNSPFDIYAPVRFLDGDFWKERGLASFLDFKQHFGVYVRRKLRPDENGKQREFDKLVGYKNLDELKAILEPISTRVLKADVLKDLPEKLYSKQYVDMNPEQERVYEQLRDEYLAIVPNMVKCVGCGGHGQVQEPYSGVLLPCDNCGGSGEMIDTVTAELTITRYLRLQQVVCGYVPTDHGEEPTTMLGDGIPRVAAAVDWAKACGHKGLIWARFQMDIDLVAEALRKEGFRVATYDGRTSSNDRDWAKWRLQGRKPVMEGGHRVGWEDLPESEQVDFFLANPAAAGAGLTLTAARSSLYYSNTYKLRDRLQSEDRNHRIGQHSSVVYTDLITPGTMDEKIVKALRMKLDVASLILGDDIKEWI